MSGKGWFGKPSTDKKDSGGSIFDKSTEESNGGIFSNPQESTEKSIFSPSGETIQEDTHTSSSKVLEQQNHGEYQQFFDNILNEYKKIVQEMKDEYNKVITNNPINPDVEEDVIKKTTILKKRKRLLGEIFQSKIKIFTNFSENQYLQAKRIGQVPTEFSQYRIQLNGQITQQALKISSQ